MAVAIDRSHASSSSKRAYQVLHIGFTVAPLMAGADKFFNLLTNWEKYLAPQVGRFVEPVTFMRIVGVVEVVASMLVAFRPKIGGIVLAAWLGGIIVNLLMIPGYFDVALRDLGLLLGAVALAFLAKDWSD